jgi:serine/threonine-protein kinase
LTLQPGQNITHYRVVEKIGEGGMGEVFRAEDTRLGRSVALKVLPESVVRDAGHLARFSREAQILASLNHPNIAGIHGLEEAGGITALALELVEGETLAERIARGSIPLDEAIRIAIQMTEALEAAHDKGIIHRDLKPGNVKFSLDGRVKVLDFGLAKDVSRESSSPDLTQSPTMTAMATQAGVILGTASYMSPEQARGQAADRRSDVFSFGVVLVEMLTGRRPFGGATVSDILADILRAEVDLSTLPPGTPAQVRRLLGRCLEKDPVRRLQAIGDARIELQEALDQPEIVLSGDPPAGQGSSRRASLAIALLTVLAVLTGAGALWGWMRTPSASGDIIRLSIELPPEYELEASPTISHDGRHVAYVARRGVEPTRLYVRSLDAYEARAIPGTENADQPFFSPDARSIGFFADGSLKVVELSGGSPRTLAPSSNSFGGTWGIDDQIIFTTTINAGLMRIPATGGTVENLTKPDLAGNGYAHVWPRSVPGKNRVVFSIWGDNPGTCLLDPATGTWQTLGTKSGGTLLASDRLLSPWNHEVEGDIAALRVSTIADDSPGPFDYQATVLTGIYAVPWRDEPWFSVAANGTLAYVPGTVADRRLVWVDESGRIDVASDVRAVHDNLALSPDGRNAVAKNYGDLWVYDLEAGTRIRLTTEAFNGGPVWDRNGKRIFFSSNRGGDWDLYVRSADGTGRTEKLLERDYSQWAHSATPDGTLFIEEVHPDTGKDIWTLTADGAAEPFLVTPANESDARIAPDGRHLAYTSNESGRTEVYVLPFPGPGPRLAVSRDGGDLPRWSPDGQTLFYVQGNAIMAADLDRAGDLRVNGMREQFTGKFLTRYSWTWDMSPDGRFLMILRDPGSVPDRINIVLNWTDELRELSAAD